MSQQQQQPMGALVAPTLVPQPAQSAADALLHGQYQQQAQPQEPPPLHHQQPPAQYHVSSSVAPPQTRLFLADSVSDDMLDPQRVARTKELTKKADFVHALNRAVSLFAPDISAAIIMSLNAEFVTSDDLLPLPDFIREILRRSKSSFSTLQLALFYVFKFASAFPRSPLGRPADRVVAVVDGMPATGVVPLARAVPIASCPRRLFLAALILASKYLQDKNYSSRAWSKISGLPPREINSNEMDFLTVVDHRLFVLSSTFAKWTGTLIAHITSVQRQQAQHRQTALSPAELAAFHAPVLKFDFGVSVISHTDVATSNLRDGLPHTVRTRKLETFSPENEEEVASPSIDVGHADPTMTAAMALRPPPSHRGYAPQLPHARIPTTTALHYADNLSGRPIVQQRPTQPFVSPASALSAPTSGGYPPTTTPSSSLGTLPPHLQPQLQHLQHQFVFQPPALPPYPQAAAAQAPHPTVSAPSSVTFMSLLSTPAPLPPPLHHSTTNVSTVYPLTDFPRARPVAVPPAAPPTPVSNFAPSGVVTLPVKRLRDSYEVGGAMELEAQQRPPKYAAASALAPHPSIQNAAHRTPTSSLALSFLVHNDPAASPVPASEGGTPDGMLRAQVTMEDVTMSDTPGVLDNAYTTNGAPPDTRQAQNGARDNNNNNNSSTNNNNNGDSATSAPKNESPTAQADRLESGQGAATDANTQPPPSTAAAAAAAAAAVDVNATARQPTLSGPKSFQRQVRIVASQMAVMLKRNFTLITLKQSRETLYPLTYPLIGVQPCQGSVSTAPCMTIAYTPDNDMTRVIMTSFDKLNAQRIGRPLTVSPTSWTDVNAAPTTQMGIVPFGGSVPLYDYVLQNPNTTQFGVQFASLYPNVRYQIWFNASQTLNGSDIFDVQLHSLERGLDEAIISVSTSSNALSNPSQFTTQGVQAASVDVIMKDWPKVKPGNLPDSMVSTLGAMFFFCSEMVIFISVLQNVVTEKELHLRHAMETMGLKASVYWISMFLAQALLVAIASLVTCVMGIVCKFTIFTQSSFAVTFLTFFLYGLAMVSFAFFVTTFCRRARVAVLIGMFLFIIGLVFESFVFSSAYVGYIWWDAGTAPIARQILYIFPFFNFGKIFLDIGLLTTGSFNQLTGTSQPGPGFYWSDLYQPVPSNVLPLYKAGGVKPPVPPPVDSWVMLIMNILVFGALTWYLDKVIPDEYGRRYPPWFPFLPRFWGLQIGKQFNLATYCAANKKLSEKPEYQVVDEDVDVAQERVKAFDQSANYPVRINNLRKVYRNSLFRATPNDKVAVKSLCLTLEVGSLLALLGQNGAGKSTTMSCLSGLTPPSGGDAVFFGRTVTEDMDAIRSMMGICPQHDILFDDLTPVEHLQLYGGLKNLTREEIARITKERLEAVRLWKVKDQKSGTFSGGMKRRLSVVISTIGDPRIVFLDEPTTGMDPVNRRHVWTFLEKFKAGRIVILTTHSMEEADVLGDSIAIMAKGRLRALGASVHLKRSYGEGYRIGLTTTQQTTDATKKLVSAHISEAELEDDSAGSLIYRVPAAHIDKVPNFVKVLESDEGSRLVQSWGLSQTTLEEIFLKLIRGVKE
ncbi:hypothetical protein RI367_006679 [Sorochytrium milnesiophthora]